MKRPQNTITLINSQEPSKNQQTKQIVAKNNKNKNIPSKQSTISLHQKSKVLINKLKKQIKNILKIMLI